MEDKRSIHFVSEVHGSIGEITLDLYEGLKNDFIITREWLLEIPEKNDILLCHFVNLKIIEAPAFKLFRRKVLIQPIDGTEIKEEYVEAFNKFDLIICPAQASINILRENGVTVNMEVIPNYFKKDIFTKEVFTGVDKYIPQNKFVFYHESTFHPRKGIELLYEGYVKAFSNTKDANDILLVLKDQPHNPRTFKDIESLKRQTIKLQKKYENPARIIKFSSYLNEDELKSLWHRTNCYVSFAKIEGFGIPMLRHAVLNKPILCLDNDNSGYQSYLNKVKNCSIYIVPTTQVKAKNEFMEMYKDTTSWAVPYDIELIVRQFRNVYYNHKEKVYDRNYDYNNFIEYQYEKVVNRYKIYLNII